MLLSSAMRTTAITGDPRYVHGWFSGRQWGGWAGQWGAQKAAATDPLRSLEELHASGVVTDAEFEQLRARVGR